MSFALLKSRTRANAPIFDFQKTIAPIPLDDFLLSYWEQQPLIVQRNAPDYYHELLTIADIDYAITNMALRYPAFRVVKYGEQIPIESYTKTVESRMEPIPGVLDIDQVLKLYGDGATVVIQGMQRYWQPLAAFCDRMGKTLSAQFKTNIYLTPPNAQGFDTHWDNHDVMVLQIAGRKHWRIYDAPVVLPDQPDERYDARQYPLGDPTHDFVLEAGDFIYLPRGYIHEALTADQGSLHITVGIHHLVWRRLLQELLEQGDNERLVREALPAGFAQQAGVPPEAEQHFAALADLLKTKLPTAFDAMRENFVANHAPFRAGGLLDMNQVDQLDLTSTVRLRPTAIWHLQVADELATLATSAKKQITLPAFTEESLRFALRGEPFQIGALAGPLDDGSKLVLVKRLVREGLLEIVMLRSDTSHQASVTSVGENYEKETDTSNAHNTYTARKRH
ncbi:MAG: cupin domain-containing protein [Caldilineaceae bacterium]